MTISFKSCSTKRFLQSLRNAERRILERGNFRNLTGSQEALQSDNNLFIILMLYNDDINDKYEDDDDIDDGDDDADDFDDAYDPPGQKGPHRLTCKR